MTKTESSAKISAHYTLGMEGEERACEYLQNTGYTILNRRIRIEGIEIDIIAEDADGTLVFVEVKTRRNEIFKSPEEAVDIKKQHRMIKAADSYIREHDMDTDIRFDIIAIVKNECHSHIDHIKGAFSPFV